MTDHNIDIVDSDRWTCKHCYNTYSYNYKYKTHLQRCLVHCQHVEQHNNIMLELKTELKNELRDLFHDMLNEIKGDLQQHIQTVQPITQKKKSGISFLIHNTFNN